MENLTGLPAWELGVLGIHNPTLVPLKPYFEKVKESIEKVDGDIVELGVWRGASLLTTALILKNNKSTKKVHGFDTFEGFPLKSKFDDFKLFEEYFRKGEIDEEHILNVRKNEKLLASLERSTDYNRISTSADFSQTSLNLVTNKAALLNIEEYIVLNKQDIISMNPNLLPERISIALIDLDLYEGYEYSLPLIWSRLSNGGIIYLDEYYSLKFPGPFKAVRNFCDAYKVEVEQVSNWLDFPRYILKKN